MTVRETSYTPGLSRWVVVIGVILAIVVACGGYISFLNLTKSTEQYNICRNAGVEMQEASDYLTDQARYFAVLAKVEYMQNYFTEANVTKRRNNAVAELQENFAGSEALNDLQQSFIRSVQLMQTEYYSMRLVCEAANIDESLWPD